MSVSRFSRVHAVCRMARAMCGGKHDKPCKLCPSREQMGPHKGKRGCRALAEEIIAVAKTGSPFSNRRHTAAWRKRFNEP